MPNNVIVLGTQWGDEGKGKVADLLTSKANIVVRSQGGNNAGHTLVVGNKKVVVRLVPSGILHKSCLCLIGSGVVVNPGALFEEIEELNKAGVEDVEKRIKVSGASALLIKVLRNYVVRMLSVLQVVVSVHAMRIRLLVEAFA